MEYLDILDKNGNKTGEKRPRKEVHSKGGKTVVITSNEKSIVKYKKLNTNKIIN